MSYKIAGLAVLGLLATAPMSMAQETLAPGANSFTEGQVRGRIEDAGFKDVSGLRKDDNGIWRGRATRNGAPTEVGVDFRGNVVAGAATAAPGTAGNNAINVGPTGSGTPGNPPGTAATRALDNAAGTNTSGANPAGNAPDGTPGNPPGTAAGRAVDRALGTNSTGANPSPAAPSR